jgi:Haemolysin-III related
MEYLNKLAGYVGDKVTTWGEEIAAIADTPEFDFLELKPIFSEKPNKLVQYVTRCKYASFNLAIVPLFIHMLCAVICLGSSAVYHLFKDHSELVHRSLIRLDYAGISIMIAGS